MILDSDFYFGKTGFPIAICREGAIRTTKEWPDYTEVEHSHNFWEMILVLAGQGMHCLQGKSFPTSAGDIFLLQKGQKHYFHDLKDIDLVNILYDPEKLKLPEAELRKLPGYCALFMLEPQHRKHHRFSSRLHLQRKEMIYAEKILFKIEDEYMTQKAGWEISSLTSLLELIIYISKQYTNNQSPDAVSLLRVADIISLLEQKYADSWKLENLTEIANMSSGNLIRVFSKATGQTPIDYLIGIRLKHAVTLIRTTNMNVTEIAFQVGFNDSNYFSRLFKKKFNCTVREFRLRND